MNKTSTLNIQEVIKFYNLDDKTFKTDFEGFVLKICENCPKIGYQLRYKLDKADNAYYNFLTLRNAFFSLTNCQNCKKTMKYCNFFVPTDLNETILERNNKKVYVSLSTSQCIKIDTLFLVYFRRFSKPSF